jgi:sugar phosphate isomerase/epimerase
VSFADRVQAAAAAGFDGIGLRAENYWNARESGIDAAAMARLAADAGVPVLEVEYLTGWGTEADRDEAQQRREATVFEMARTFGVHHVNAGLLEKLPINDISDALGDLCDRTGHKVSIALEFMPYSGVPDLATAWRILRNTGCSNSALIVDVWHWARAGMTAADLEPVPADRIVSVQLCDVLETPMDPPRDESIGHRVLPGQGFGDAVGMVRTLQAHGVRPSIVTVEVISDELVAQGVELAARTAADAARKVLGEA